MRATGPILILGPTAAGKSALAIALATSLPEGGECISADSMQIYRGMDIGTAKPTLEQRAEVPHHLIDIAEPNDDSFSVDRWLELAHRCIAEIQSRNRWPIIVGGTNLYVQALLRGLADVPAPDPELRARLQSLSEDELRARLVQADPAAAQRIHPNDRKRTIRAIEVFETTGNRLSQMQTQWEETSKPGRESSGFLILGLEYPVDQINRRINARVKSMIEAGLVEEVRALHSAQKLGRNAQEALGYKQIIEHLDNRCSLDEAIEKIKIRTRRYAKQQRTWLRRFKPLPGSLWINAAEHSPQDVANQALTFILRQAGQSPKQAHFPA